MTGRFLHGTSSFSTKGWVGPFYPPGTKPADFLRYYATRFGTVEVDSTYYAIPSAAMVDGWDRKTPDGFVLSAKFPRSIVHGGEGARPNPETVLVPAAVEKDTQEFLSVMSRLGDKLGPLVLQFPYFNRSVFEDARPFLARLDAFLESLPDGFRYGVELRNKAWLGEPLFALLRRHRAAFVLVEIGYMPHPARLAERYDVVTADFAYARLIGDRQAVDARTQTFDALVLDKDRELDRWAGLIRDLLERVPEVYAYANNHYAGHGPATITDLAQRVARD